MVKGNAQRRLELTERRKQEQVEERERKQRGYVAFTPGEARARLLSDARAASGPSAEDELIAYIVAPEHDGKLFCVDFWRTGSCPLKRCKFAHDDSISHLQGVPADGDDASAAGAATAAAAAAASRGMPAMFTAPLRSVDPGGAFVYDKVIRMQVRTVSPLRFVALGKQLVFDFQNPSVFARYCESRAAVGAASAAAKTPDLPDAARSSRPHGGADAAAEDDPGAPPRDKMEKGEYDVEERESSSLMQLIQSINKAK